MRDLNENDCAAQVELTARIAAAYLRNHIVPVDSLGRLIAEIHAALTAIASSVATVVVAEKPKPAVAIRKSVQSNHITCLECGHDYLSLKRHLMTHHGLSPAEYRAKWELPVDYPMVAPVYAEARSQLAKRIGFGRKREVPRKMRRSR